MTEVAQINDIIARLRENGLLESAHQLRRIMDHAFGTELRMGLLYHLKQIPLSKIDSSTRSKIFLTVADLEETD